MSNAATEAATVAATEHAAADRIEIVGERRRAHAPEFRARVVMDSLVSGARISEVARRHGVCISLIYRWRRVAQQAGRSGSRMLPVRVVSPASTEAPVRQRFGASATAEAERIEIELTDGTRVRVSADVSLPAPRLVLAALRA